MTKGQGLDKELADTIKQVMETMEHIEEHMEKLGEKEKRKPMKEFPLEK